ncbi:MAG: hypothetical protein ACM3XR_04430 [Bacillota bacterium]
MRNLKKLLAVIVTVCMLATFAIPAFAEKSDADICAELGVILGSGDGVTAEYLASQPDRLQGAIMFLRLKGLEDEAKAFPGTDNFSDAEGLSETNKAILGYLKAHPELGFVGIGNNMFAPTAKMTAKEYYKVLLVALGYEDGVDFTWATLFQFAASKGLIKLLDNTEFTVNDLCIATVEALKATVKGGSETLIDFLVEEGVIAADKAKASGLYSGVPRALEVVSATADNLKTAKIVFSKALDKDTVNTDNIANSGIGDVKLLDDGKTVLVIFTDAQENGDEQEITIKNVKAADGATIAEVTKTVKFYDTTFPSVNGAVAEDAKTIVVSVSEPIELDYSGAYEVFEDIKIDDNNMVAQASFDYVKNAITFTLTEALDAGTYKLDISGLKDYAGYVALAASFNITVAEDKAAPEIVKGEVVSVSKIKVTFNENLEEIGTYEVDGKTPEKVEFDGSSKKDVILTLDDGDDTNGIGYKLNIAALVEIKVEYDGQKDVVGNEVEDKVFKFKVEDDTALPTATASLDSSNNLTITFSKAMLKEGKLTVLDKDNNEVEVITISDSDTWESNDTVLKYDADEIKLDEVNAAEYSIVLEDMYDGTIRKNPLGKTTLKVTANDTKDPGVEAFYTVDPGTASDDGDDTITFYFTEAMDTDSIKNLSNYRVTAAGANFSVGDTLALKAIGAKVKSVASDGKSITITVPKIAASPDNDDVDFVVQAVKDKAGNQLDASAAIAKYTSGFGVTGVVAKGSKLLEVTFNTAVKSFSTSVFTGVYNSKDEFVAYVKNYEIDGTKVKLTLSKDIDTDPAGYYLKPKSIAPSEITAAKNIYGVALKVDLADVSSFTDEIAPTAKVETGDNAGEIKITFSETVKFSGGGLAEEGLAEELVIRKSDGTLLKASNYSVGELTGGNTVVITIKDDDGYAVANTEYKVSIVSRGNIEDEAGNVLAEMAETKVKTGSN